MGLAPLPYPLIIPTPPYPPSLPPFPPPTHRPVRLEPAAAAARPTPSCPCDSPACPSPSTPAATSAWAWMRPWHVQQRWCT